MKLHLGDNLNLSFRFRILQDIFLYLMSLTVFRLIFVLGSIFTFPNLAAQNLLALNFTFQVQLRMDNFFDVCSVGSKLHV